MCIEKFIYITSAFCIYPPPPLHLSRCLLQANASLILFFSSYKVPFHTRNTHIILMFVLRVILLAALIVQIQAENESNVLIFTMNTFYLFSMLTVVVVERVARLLGGQTQKKNEEKHMKTAKFLYMKNDTFCSAYVYSKRANATSNKYDWDVIRINGVKLYFLYINVWIFMWPSQVISLRRPAAGWNRISDKIK